MNTSKSTWDEVIDLLDWREQLVKRISESISHLPILNQLYIVTSYIPLDYLEEAAEIICKDDYVPPDS